MAGAAAKKMAAKVATTQTLYTQIMVVLYALYAFFRVYRQWDDWGTMSMVGCGVITAINVIATRMIYASLASGSTGTYCEFFCAASLVCNPRAPTPSPLHCTLAAKPP
jgi:hypothetical protein